MHAPTAALGKDRTHATRILVVDDDLDLRECVVDLLRAEGYVVAQASNGQEALHHLRSGGPPPRLVLLDLSMPVMDGWQCHRELQADPALAVFPVVVVSGRRDGEPAVPVPADRFLRKPFDDEALLTMVQRHCAARPVGRSAGHSCRCPCPCQVHEEGVAR